MSGAEGPGSIFLPLLLLLLLLAPASGGQRTTGPVEVVEVQDHERSENQVDSLGPTRAAAGRLARTAARADLGLAQSATLLLDVHHGPCVCTELACE